MPGNPDVVVVGAGLSGLSAARELERAGCEVLVLEARDRPGGRTEVIGLDGVVVDLGGEWIDAAHVEIRGLADELGFRLVPSDRSKERSRWFVKGTSTDGMPLLKADAEVYEKMNAALVETASGVDLDAPWEGAPSTAEDASVEDWLRDAGMSEGGIHAVETLASSCGSTVPLDRMSLYSYAVKVATRGGPGKGNEYRVEGGAGGISTALARELADAGAEMRYSSPATEVRQADGGVEVRYEGPEGPGITRARKAILALPFTCYRDIRFDPPPPPVIRQLIGGSVYGVVRKMHFIFDEPVDASAFTVTDTILGYCSPAQASGEAAGIVSFCGGRPLLPELGRVPEERKKRAVRLLRELYDMPEPVAVTEKVWPEEHWTRGSYMIMAPGNMALFGEALGTGFGDVRLAGAEGFAAAPSFMNSAVKSGIRAGREVAEALGRGAVHAR